MVLEAAFKTRRQDSVIVNVPVPLAHNCSAEQQWYDLRGRRKMTSARLNIKYVLPALPRQAALGGHLFGFSLSFPSSCELGCNMLGASRQFLTSALQVDCGVSSVAHCLLSSVEPSDHLLGVGRAVTVAVPS